MNAFKTSALTALCLALAGGILSAQDYTNNFSAIKVDRGKGPATFHGGFTVDPATGALSVELPVGPGIGNSRLHFTPALRARWSPQWSETLMVKMGGSWACDVMNMLSYYNANSTSDTGYSTTYSYTNRSQSQRAGGFDNWFGGLQLTLGEGPNTAMTMSQEMLYTPPSVAEEAITQIQLPDGSRHSISVNSTAQAAADVSALLQAFGYGQGYKVAPDPNQGWVFNADGTPAHPYALTSDEGDLVVGLYGLDGSMMDIKSYVLPTAQPSDMAPEPLIVAPTDRPQDTSNFLVPPKILVVHGDELVEFDLVSAYYTPPTQVLDNTIINAADSVSRRNAICFCLGANYQPVRMVNRVGDAIQFSYAADGTQTATWVPAEGGTGASITFGSTVQYHGGQQNPSYQVLGGPSAPSPSQAGSYFKIKPILIGDWFPGGLMDVGTGEQVTFNYSDFAAPVAPGGIADIQPETVLSSAAINSRSLTFHWTQYGYRFGQDDFQSQSNAADQNGIPQPNTFLPHLAMGITAIDETDTKTSVTRTESHVRVVPQPNLTLPSGASYWNSTDFYDAIIHPDGRVTLNVYVQPEGFSMGQTWPASASVAGLVRARAYAKHQIQEVREYAAPTGSQDPLYWQADFSATKNSPASSLAYKVTEYDRWDFHGIGNASGALDVTSVPHPTRTRVWDANNQILTVSETSGWDSVNRDYASTTTWICSSSASLAGRDYLAVDFPGSGISLSTPAGVLRQEQTTRQLSSVIPQWLFARSLSEATLVQSDSSAGNTSGVVFPFALPPLSRTYNTDTFDQIHDLTHGSASGPHTTVTFIYGTGTTQGELMSASVAGSDGSTPMVNSGLVGASYQYDANGFMNQIKPSGIAWSYQQSQDGLGLAQSQTDPNGVVTGYQWDAGCRLSGIVPPGGESSTHVTVDSDNLGFTVTHGQQASRYRFNAFGEMVMEQRSLDGGATWSSHKNSAYDPAGRKVAETLWVAGAGDEIQSAHPTATQVPVVVGTAPGYWTDGVSGTGQSIQVWVPPSTITRMQSLDPLSFASFWSYDAQGRPTGSVDANGMTTAITYGLRSHTTTIGAGSGATSTIFTSDELGRLVQIIDPMNQVTQYAYDPAGHIKQVVQTDPVTGAQQIRGWNYDALGRLTSLIQPESGTTSYSAFTVTGKPTVTVYGDGSSGPRKVTTTFDSLDRVGSVIADDGSVHQTFSYDEPGHGLSLGKLTTGSDGGVTRSLAYSGLNGRLSSLTLGVDGRSFTSGLGYNSDGNLNSRTYPDNRVESIPFDLARGVPNGAALNGSNLLTLAFDPTHWGLTAMTYTNGGNSFFTYDADQVRLKTMTHTAGAQTLAGWSFSYDSRGNLLGDGEDVYGYDALDRLVLSYTRDPLDTLVGHGLKQTTNYDAFGNRFLLNTARVTNWTDSTSLSAPALTGLSTSDTRSLTSFAMATPELMTMAATNHLPSTAGGVATGASYDAQGNLVSLYATPGSSSSQLTMTYDALGRVTQLSDASKGTTEKYSYDDEGLRSMVEVWQGGELQSKRYLIYNESRQLVAEYDLVLR